MTMKMVMVRQQQQQPEQAMDRKAKNLDAGAPPPSLASLTRRSGRRRGGAAAAAKNSSTTTKSLHSFLEMAAAQQQSSCDKQKISSKCYESDDDSSLGDTASVASLKTMMIARHKQQEEEGSAFSALAAAAPPPEQGLSKSSHAALASLQEVSQSSDNADLLLDGAAKAEVLRTPSYSEHDVRTTTIDDEVPPALAKLNSQRHSLGGSKRTLSAIINKVGSGAASVREVLESYEDIMAEFDDDSEFF